MRTAMPRSQTYTGWASGAGNRSSPTATRVPVIYDVDECIGCRLCEVSCHYDAIYMIPGRNKVGGDEIAEFNADRCFGCGLCVVRCPTDALFMPMLQQDGIYLHPKTLQPAEPGEGSVT